jgi:hypothetical protein
MKYIITEDQRKRLFESDDYQKRWNKFELKMKRRNRLIDDLIDRTLADEDPNDWDDMYDYAGYIIREVSSEIMYGENGAYSEGDDEFELEAWIDHYLKDNFVYIVFEYYKNSRKD